MISWAMYFVGGFKKTLLFFKRLKNNTNDCWALTERPSLFIKNLCLVEKGDMEMPKIITSPWSLEEAASILETISSDYTPPEGQPGESLSRDQITTLIDTFRQWTEILPAESHEAIEETLQRIQRLLGSVSFDPQRVQAKEEILDLIETAIFALLFGLEHDLSTADELYPLFEVLAQTYLFLNFRRAEKPSSSPRLLNEKERQRFTSIVQENLSLAQVDSQIITSIVTGLGTLLQLIPLEPAVVDVLASEFSNNAFILFEDLEWVPRPGDAETRGGDRPRYLTPEEIEDILQAIPRIFSAAVENAETAYSSLIAKLRADLEQVQICPSSILNFKQDMVTQFNKSRVTPGTNVGIIAANAIGEQTTQMTLNSVVGETQILIKKSSGVETVEIGAWIDTLMESQSQDIQLYPQNRTEYLPLTTAVEIHTVDKDGHVFWSTITAVTRHLPGGDLVKIKTHSGREVIATESKSLLIWDEKTRTLIQTNGSDVKVGDYVPVMKTALPASQAPSVRVHNDIVLDKIVAVEHLPCSESFTPNVYDLTVPSTTNFCLANGLGVADTFHSAGGDANVSQGIKALTELVYARLSRHYPRCTVIFKKRLTLSQIFASKSALVQTTIQDLVVDYSIENVPEEKKYWYAFFPAVPQDPYQYVLRLHLNPVRMLERRVTMQDVAKTLLGESTASSIYVAHSSTSEGILDIYTNPKRIAAALEKIQKQLQQKQTGVASFRTEYSSRVFLSNVILPNLKNMRVKGVAGITEIFPVKEPVWSLILKERKPTGREMKDWELETDRHWYVLELDPTKLRTSPIRPQYLYEFLESLQMRIVEETSTYALIQTPTDLEDDPFPSRIRDRMLMEAKEVFRQTGQRELLLDLENYYYVTTRGSNITRLLQKKEIDPYYTHCNDIHAMIKLLGIEAARQFFIKELHDTIRSAGGYVNARHITLTADALFKQGIFLGTNYTGMYNGSAGYFSLSTHQRCTQTLSRAATFSEREALTGTSSAIAVGATVQSGTGFMDVIPAGPRITTNPVQVQPPLETVATPGVQESSNPMIVASDGCPNDFDVLMSLKGPKPSLDPPTLEGRIPRPNLTPQTTVTQDLASPLQTAPEKPTPLVVSENLREAVNKIYFDPRVAETETVEQVTTVEEIPSEVRQAPITSFVPPPLSIPAEIPLEITRRDIAPLAPLDRRIRYTKAPVMRLRPS
jgi:DNA-directed RNA polymerase beta' subunit